MAALVLQNIETYPSKFKYCQHHPRSMAIASCRANKYLISTDVAVEGFDVFGFSTLGCLSFNCFFNRYTTFEPSTGLHPKQNMVFPAVKS